MPTVLGFEGSANKIGVGVVRDGAVLAQVRVCGIDSSQRPSRAAAPSIRPNASKVGRRARCPLTELLIRVSEIRGA